MREQVHICACAHGPRSEVTLGCCSLSSITMFVEKASLLGLCLSDLARLAGLSEPQGTSCSQVPGAGITSVRHHIGLSDWRVEIEVGSWCICGEHFTDRTISPEPDVYFYRTADFSEPQFLV